MGKRCKVFVYGQIEAPDGYGGFTITQSLQQTLFGTLTADIRPIITDIKGSNEQVATWLKVHKEIVEPADKVLKINGTDFRVLNTINNISNKFYYQVEQLKG